jgi:hypothetical protein
LIRYSLRCDASHEFEGWFSSSGDFDRQQQRGLVTCPACGSSKVEKALMAPSVTTGEEREQKAALAVDTANKEILAKMRDVVKQIRENSEDVGDRFPEEARKIHYGEAEARGIIGQAKREDVGALIDEGIEVAPLPVLPEDVN